MPDSHCPFGEPPQNLPGKNIVHCAQVPVGRKNAVVIDDNAAAFLPPVLEGVESVIRKSRKVGTLGAVHTEHAAFFMYFCHGVPLPEKKIKRPPGAENTSVRMSAFTH